MTPQEARIFKRLVQENLDVKGGCKILSQGEGCDCPLCQIDKMDPDKFIEATERIIEEDLEQRSFLIGALCLSTEYFKRIDKSGSLGQDPAQIDYEKLGYKNGSLYLKDNKPTRSRYDRIKEETSTTHD